MKVAVITAGFYDRDYSEKLSKLQWSAEKFNIDLHIYGRGKFFSFYQSKIVDLGNYINEFKNDYTHVLYTDASDSFFMCGMEEIESKYQDIYNGKLVVSGEKSLHPFGTLKYLFPESHAPWRYMNPGNFLGPIQEVLDTLSKLKTYSHLKTDDQGHWMEAYAASRIVPVVDHRCLLFQTMSDVEFGKEVTVSYGRIINNITNTFPCVVHFNGPKGDSHNGRIMQETFLKIKSFYENTSGTGAV